MEYEVVKKINFKKADAQRVGEFWYRKSDDALYFESPHIFPTQLMISEGLSKCQVTPHFLRLPFILKGWINLDILLRLIDVLKLALQGRILMHGSCVDNTLIVGFPNAGKTYQTYKNVSEGGKLISEEYTVINPKTRTASPYKPVMRTCFSRRTIKDCKITMSPLEHLSLIFSEIRAWAIPYMFEGAIWKEIPASGDTAEIEKILYGSSGQEVIHWKAFAILCENEFPFMASEFLQAYAIASGLDLLSIQAKQRNLIKELYDVVYPRSKQKRK